MLQFISNSEHYGEVIGRVQTEAIVVDWDGRHQGLAYKGG